MSGMCEELDRAIARENRHTTTTAERKPNMADDETPTPEETPPVKKTATKKRAAKAATARPLIAVPAATVKDLNEARTRVEARTQVDEPGPLEPEQLARVEALKQARTVLISRGPLGSGQVEPIHVIDVAEFILSGLHPLTKYAHADTDDTDETGPGLGFLGPQEGTTR